MPDISHIRFKRRYIKNRLKEYPLLFNSLRGAYRFSKALKRFCLKKDLNYFKCFISARLRLSASMGRPIHLTIEPANICNLKCPICESGTGSLHRMPVTMKFEEFKYIIDQFDNNLKTVYLYFMGEPFLNRDIYKMARYAADKGLYVAICTNGECVDPEELVKSRAAEVQFQIAGTTGDIHSIYRRGGDLNKTLQNLRQTVKAERECLQNTYNKKYPLKINCGFILMKYNEHQVDDFIRLAEGIGVDDYYVIDPCVRDIEQARVFLPSDKRHWRYDPGEFTKGRLRVKNQPHNYCEWVYATMTVLANGDVVPCCSDPKGDYTLGNVFKKNIYTIWNDDKIKKVRNLIGANQRRFNLCKLCEGYPMPYMP